MRKKKSKNIRNKGVVFDSNTWGITEISPNEPVAKVIINIVYLEKALKMLSEWNENSYEEQKRITLSIIPNEKDDCKALFMALGDNKIGFMLAGIELEEET